MKKINIVGDIFSTSGYASHTKSLANALYKVADVRITTQAIPGWEKLVNDAELDMVTKPEADKETTIVISTPNNWKLFLGTGINCGYCVWEGDKVPEGFIEEFINPKIDYIFVPSKHTKIAIENTIEEWEGTEQNKILDKIKLIPHGVDLEAFNNLGIIDDTRFSFICNKGWRGTSWDRGGVQYVIKAFAEEFKKGEKVELVVKLNPAYINGELLPQYIEALNLPEDRAPIKIIVDNYDKKKLNILYNNSDCYICATRSESFNLPGLEAMATGIPTIQTNFGGQTDYMNDKNSLFIDYKLEVVKEDYMYEEIKWATPIMDDIKKAMRLVFESKTFVKNLGKQAEEDAKKFTWDSSAQKILEILK